MKKAIIPISLVAVAIIAIVAVSLSMGKPYSENDTTKESMSTAEPSNTIGPIETATPSSETLDFEDEAIITPPPIEDVLAEMNGERNDIAARENTFIPVHDSINTISKSLNIDDGDMSSIRNLILNTILKETGSNNTQLLDINSTSTYNAIATAVTIIDDGENQTYKTIKYDLKQNNDGTWDITNTYPQGSFDTAHYDIIVDNGSISVTPKTEVSGDNFTNEIIESIKSQVDEMSEVD